MLLYPYPNSHVQLIIPCQYRYGGKPYSLAKSAAWDQNPNTYVIGSGTLSDIRFDFPAAGPIPKYFFLHLQGSVSAGNYSCLSDSPVLQNTDSIEEDRGQSSTDWTVTATTHVPTGGGGATRRRLLLELDTAVALNWVRWQVNSITGTVYCHHAIFSHDFRLPMYDSNWSASHTFESDNAPVNPSGVTFPNFTEAGVFELNTRHSFRWSELTAVEYQVWLDAITEFGGQIAQPFVLCVMNGTQPHGFKTMRSRLLVIEPQTLRYGQRKDSGLYSVEFTAVELHNYLPLDITRMPTVASATLDYTTIDDNYIESISETNWGTNNLVRVSAQDTPSVDKKRTLVSFDLSTVPQGANILSAVLSIKTTTVIGGGGNVVAIPIDHLWTETGSTWLTRDGEKAWVTAGGDYGSARADDTVNVTTDNTFYQFNVLNSVRRQHSGEGFGVILIMQTETGANHGSPFCSTNHVTAGNRPYLDITYTT